MFRLFKVATVGTAAFGIYYGYRVFDAQHEAGMRNLMSRGGLSSDEIDQVMKLKLIMRR